MYKTRKIMNISKYFTTTVINTKNVSIIFPYIYQHVLISFNNIFTDNILYKINLLKTMLKQSFVINSDVDKNSYQHINKQ